MLEERGLEDRVVVESAGTGDWHVGADADPRALAALRRAGYDLRHAARQFDRAWFADRDLVVALDADNLADLQALAPDPATAGRIRLVRSYDPALDPGTDLDVPDPYYGGDAGFDRVLHMLETACRGLIDQVERDLSARDASA
jgi:protein-tyrosine phosphatase